MQPAHSSSMVCSLVSDCRATAERSNSLATWATFSGTVVAMSLVTQPNCSIANQPCINMNTHNLVSVHGCIAVNGTSGPTTTTVCARMDLAGVVACWIWIWPYLVQNVHTILCTRLFTHDSVFRGHTENKRRSVMRMKGAVDKSTLRSYPILRSSREGRVSGW